MSSTWLSRPVSPKAAAAAARTFSRLRRASARSGRGAAVDKRNCPSICCASGTTPHVNAPTPGAPLMTDAQAAERRKWLALALLATTQFVIVLDAAIVNVAIPSIGADLRFSPENLAWIPNAYALTFGGF